MLPMWSSTCVMKIQAKMMLFNHAVRSNSYEQDSWRHTHKNFAKWLHNNADGQDREIWTPAKRDTDVSYKIILKNTPRYLCWSWSSSCHNLQDMNVSYLRVDVLSVNIPMCINISSHNKRSCALFALQFAPRSIASRVTLLHQEKNNTTCESYILNMIPHELSCRLDSDFDFLQNLCRSHYSFSHFILVHCELTTVSWPDFVRGRREKNVFFLDKLSALTQHKQLQKTSKSSFELREDIGVDDQRYSSVFNLSVSAWTERPQIRRFP